MPISLPQSIFLKAFRGLLHKTLPCICFSTLLVYILVAISTRMGWLAVDWDAVVGASAEAPNWTNCFGTDILGQSVLAKVMHGAEVAMYVGCIVALFAILLGVTLGIVAGYFGGIVDEFVVWLYTVVASIPTMLLLIVVAFIMGKGIRSICVALVVAEWADVCRLVRGEVMRHNAREYIQAASAIGAGNARKLFVHIFPNILPLVIYQFSLLFQTAIKYEVMLSYLGLGVQNKPSWGIMISDAKTGLLQGIWWELFFPTVALFLLVFVVNILADALRDELDPKLKDE